jgi:hypothetical protein
VSRAGVGALGSVPRGKQLLQFGQELGLVIEGDPTAPHLINSFADVTYFGLDATHGRRFYVCRTNLRGADFEPLDGNDELMVDVGNTTSRIRAD